MDSSTYQERDTELRDRFLERIRQENAQRAASIAVAETVTPPTVEHTGDGGYRLHSANGPSVTVFPESY